MSKAFEFYKQFIGPDDLVFDIGAHLGQHTEVFSRLAAKVVAVEPLEHIYHVLWTVFQYNEKVVPVLAACGTGLEGAAHIKLYDSNYPLAGISSMSEEWIEAVCASGRFEHGEQSWINTQEVQITTLNHLMSIYGVPSFIKIDVEGYESHVIKNLSPAVKALSFEWTPEHLVDTFECIDYLDSIGMSQFAISTRESFELSYWKDAQRVKDNLSLFGDDNEVYGDVYARLP